MTQGLLKSEELDRHEIEALIGPSVHKARELEKAARGNILAPDTPPTITGNAEATK